MCRIKVDTHLATLIVWDEAPMTHPHAFEAVDRTLRDVMSASQDPYSHLPFEGKTVVLGGDFRQVLPVVRRGDKATIMAAAIRNSYLWQRGARHEADH